MPTQPAVHDMIVAATQPDPRTDEEFLADCAAAGIVLEDRDWRFVARERAVIAARNVRG